MRAGRSGLVLFLVWLAPLAMAVPPEGRQQGSAASQSQKAEAEFRRLAAQLADERLAEAPGNEKLLEQALAILDRIILEALNGRADPDFEALNRRLEMLTARRPLEGEEYRVLSLSMEPAAYALVANFGLGGPSAVRLYAQTAGHYTLAARIDAFVQKGFFDEYLELVPIAGPTGASAAVFVSVSGRIDDLQTGSFTAWRFDGHRVEAVWSSDLVQQSSYDAGLDGFRLTYCAEPDEDKPHVCRRMTRDRYVWDGTTWKRVEQIPVAVPKR